MAALAPKSLHFICFAMRYASVRDRGIWEAVDHDTSKELPPAALRAAMNALRLYEAKLQARLDSPSIDEDEMADASNDLGTVQAILRGLSRRLEPAEAVAA